MKFVRSTVGFTVAVAAVLALLLNAGVFAYSARTSGIQASSSPLHDKHESTSTQTSAHAGTQESDQTNRNQGGQNRNQGNENDETGNQDGRLHFTLHSPTGTNNGKEDRGQASIVIDGNALGVEISVKKTTPSATFTVVLVAIPIPATSSSTASTTTTFSTTMTSTSTITSSTITTAASCAGSTIGTFVTGGDGEGDAELSTTLNSGTYALGLVLCSNNVPALVSHPATIKAVVPQGGGENKVDSDSETTTSSEMDSDDETTTTTVTTSATTVFSTRMPSTTTLSSSTGSDDDNSDTVNPVTKTSSDDTEITTAMSDKTIPAVIGVFNSGVTLHQLDPHFSVAASRLAGNGIMISISAQNVTGSKVLLVNLTGSQWSASSLKSLKVMFDGAAISQAASLSQVLSSSSADPARYIIMLTSSGLQLLVSIPHFSLHTIQLIPTAAAGVGSGPINGALLVEAIVLLAALSAAAYSVRRRVYSFFK